jgi:uncharacterized membrane protein YoaK (UPF0700 family)
MSQQPKTEQPEPFRKTLAYLYVHLLAMIGAAFVGLVTQYFTHDSVGLVTFVAVYGFAIFLED